MSTATAESRPDIELALANANAHAKKLHPSPMWDKAHAYLDYLLYQWQMAPHADGLGTE